MLTPPTNYILTLVKPFSFIWYVIPLLKTGAFDLTHNLFLRFSQLKTSNTTGVAMSLLCYWLQYLPYGHLVASNKALDLLHWEICSIVPAHCRGHQNGHFFWCICWLLFVCLLPWRPLGQYGVSRRPMAASSGFWSSPGHAASGNALHIALADRRGHWNWRQTRYIWSSLTML